MAACKGLRGSMAARYPAASLFLPASAMATTAQELFVIFLTLTGAIGAAQLWNHERTRLAIGWFVAFTIVVCVLAIRWDISTGL